MMQLSYSFRNEKSPTRISLLHGLACTRQVWEGLSPRLEKEFALLIPDQRGHGASRTDLSAKTESSLGFGPLDYGRDLIDTLQAANFSPSWIIGHSMSVRTACAAAHLRPASVSGLILVDLPLVLSEEVRVFRERMHEFFKNWPMEFPSKEDAVAYVAKFCPDASLIGSFLSSLVVTPVGRVEFNLDKVAILETFRRGPEADLFAWICKAAIQEIPILVLRGKESRFWSEEDFEAARKRYRSYPSVFFMQIEQAGHALPFEQPDAFVEATVQFIKSRRCLKIVKTG